MIGGGKRAGCSKKNYSGEGGGHHTWTNGKKGEVGKSTEANDRKKPPRRSRSESKKRGRWEEERKGRRLPVWERKGGREIELFWSGCGSTRANWCDASVDALDTAHFHFYGICRASVSYLQPIWSTELRVVVV